MSPTPADIPLILTEKISKSSHLRSWNKKLFFLFFLIHCPSNTEMNDSDARLREVRSWHEHWNIWVTLFFLLSDSTSQFLQHSQAFLVVLGLAQPEGVLVFHDVGQHRSAEEHQVFAPGRVLDADLKLLHKRRTKRGEGIETQCSRCTCFSPSWRLL